MAAKYIKVIQTVQPEGPYFLGGACFGGSVAFEMAQQLLAFGQRTELLVIIDTPMPGKVPQRMKLSYYFGQMNAAIKMLPDWNVARIINMFKLNYLNYQAFLDYKPNIHSGKIVFFSAKELDKFKAKFLEQAWDNLATEGINIHHIPGNHVTMNYNPNVRILSEQLTIYLEEAHIKNL